MIYVDVSPFLREINAIPGELLDPIIELPIRKITLNYVKCVSNSQPPIISRGRLASLIVDVHIVRHSINELS